MHSISPDNKCCRGAASHVQHGHSLFYSDGRPGPGDALRTIFGSREEQDVRRRGSAAASDRAPYPRLARRQKIAVVALAQNLPRIAFYVLHDGTTYDSHTSAAPANNMPTS